MLTLRKKTPKMPIMKMETSKSELTPQVFDQLKDHFGNHSNVARELGIDPRHYRIIRSKMSASAGMIRLINMVAENAKGNGKGQQA